MEKRKQYFHQDFVLAVILLIIGIACFIGSYSIPRSSNPVNNIHTFPQLAAGGLIIFSLFNIKEGWKKSKKLTEDIAQGKDVVPEMSMEKLKYPMIGIVGILVYAAAVAILGFFVSTAVFMMASIYWLGYKKWPVIIATTIGLELFVYILFVKVLFTRMPAGLLF
ncbi:tripartite tricarboxylate transporter TctB family protein [Clostridium sp. AF37-5AT]|nr:tripartite tricarboxylate transporter TctB family protein [Clostridium sp. AF37-5AT]RHO95918.1 tripartite tricarboxylate transporter TctB family protein [Clostridium sp. AF37-5AT]